MSKQNGEIHLTFEQLELVNKELSILNLYVIVSVLDRRDCRRVGAMFSILSIGMEE